MKGWHYLKFMLQQEGYMCQLELKRVHISISLSENSKKIVRFHWLGNLHKFLCLCLGLDSSSRIFTKLLRILLSISRRLNFRIIIYQDGMLLLASLIEEVLMAKNGNLFVATSGYTAVLRYLLKMEETKNEFKLINVSKKIWEYRISREISVTTEYPPSAMNTEADPEFQEERYLSEWTLDSHVFQTICQVLGESETNLFTSCYSHQFHKYMDNESGYNGPGVEARPIQLRDRCNATKLVQVLTSLFFFYVL